ncbi:MAG: hypothetical protein H7X79_06685 [Sporomusaceae bacterium]|nr:hypothetical protein [Sporomusaceae bacterium]
MSEFDQFIQEDFLSFYKRVSGAFKQNHHALYSVLNSFLAGRKNHIGIRITDNEKVIGEYTLHLDGANVSHIENGVLSSEVHTPFGVVKPYIILEKSIVEKMIDDEPNFIKDLFSTKIKYASDTTVKFLK